MESDEAPLGNLDGPRWRAAVLSTQSGRRVSVALRKFLARDRGKSGRPEWNSETGFPGRIVARPEHVEEKWEPVFRPDMRQKQGQEGRDAMARRKRKTTPDIMRREWIGPLEVDDETIEAMILNRWFYQQAADAWACPTIALNCAAAGVMPAFPSRLPPTIAPSRSSSTRPVSVTSMPSVSSRSRLRPSMQRPRRSEPMRTTKSFCRHFSRRATASAGRDWPLRRQRKQRRRRPRKRHSFAGGFGRSGSDVEGGRPPAAPQCSGRETPQSRHGAHQTNRRSSTSGTGSYPQVPPGPQRMKRNSAMNDPFHSPCRATAS